MKQKPKTTEEIDSLLALHKLYVEMANAVSQRREGSNRFYLTLLGTPIALLLLASRVNQNVFNDPFIMLITGVVGLAISIFWRQTLGMYRKLNGAKFKVIMEIEDHLPYAGFAKENEYLEASRYGGLTQTEIRLPTFAIVAYSGQALYSLGLLLKPIVLQCIERFLN